MPAGQHRLFHSGLFRVETSPACFFSPATSPLPSPPFPSLPRIVTRYRGSRVSKRSFMMLLFLRTDAYYSVARVVSWNAGVVRVSFPMLFHFFLFLFLFFLIGGQLGFARLSGVQGWGQTFYGGCWSRLLVSSDWWWRRRRRRREMDEVVVVDGRVIAG